ncbi:MAG: ABC transporter permease [Oscillospiraceae bacterium]|jgi:ABC-2 type transport system permease protein|nr:ABC transporter permease [Oscillospiraceae bacterium]
MRGFFATFRMGFKYLWRSPVSAAILIGFPIVMILILGTALSSYISGETDLEPAKVAVAADPQGELAAFLRSGEIARFFTYTFTDINEARRLVEAGEVTAAVIEDASGTEVFCEAGEGFDASLALAVVDSYQEIGSAAAAAAAQGRDVYGILGQEIAVRDVPLGMRVPSATDYYAVTMLVMILMMCGTNGIEMFGKGLLSDTGSRSLLTPVSKAAHVGGLLAASTVTSFLQGMVTFVFTAAVYGVYWGQRVPLVLLALFAVVLLSQSICIMLVLLFKRPDAASGLAQGLFYVLTLVSKGYSKINFGAADAVFQYAPNAMAHTVIFGAIYGGNEAKMALYLGLLFAASAVFFAIAFILGRRRLA